jgi:hypothetical protein
MESSLINSGKHVLSYHVLLLDMRYMSAYTVIDTPPSSKHPPHSKISVEIYSTKRAHRLVRRSLALVV